MVSDRVNDRIILFIVEALTGTTTPGLSGPGSNNNEKVFHITQRSRT